MAPINHQTSRIIEIKLILFSIKPINTTAVKFPSCSPHSSHGSPLTWGNLCSAFSLHTGPRHKGFIIKRFQEAPRNVCRRKLPSFITCGAVKQRRRGRSCRCLPSALELETKVKQRFAKVSIVSYICLSLMIIGSASQFHVHLPWGQRRFSIVS